MPDQIIFHFVKEPWWLSQATAENYVSENFSKEHFIHASTSAQLQATCNRYYSEQEVIFLLHIDTEKLIALLKYEWSSSIQEEFPHIFGPLNRDAIYKVERLCKFKEEIWLLS